MLRLRDGVRALVFCVSSRKIRGNPTKNYILSSSRKVKIRITIGVRVKVKLKLRFELKLSYVTI
jgi:hypothetical protein